MDRTIMLEKLADKLGLLITDIGACERTENDLNVLVDNLEQEILEVLEQIYPYVEEKKINKITKNYCKQRMSELW